MHCNHCGKALGTHSIKCPFCGAMITNNQISTQNQFREREKELQRVKLITEQFGQKDQFQKTEDNNHQYIFFLIIGMIIIVIALLLIFIL